MRSLHPSECTPAARSSGGLADRLAESLAHLAHGLVERHVGGCRRAGVPTLTSAASCWGDATSLRTPRRLTSSRREVNGLIQATLTEPSSPSLVDQAHPAARTATRQCARRPRGRNPGRHGRRRPRAAGCHRCRRTTRGIGGSGRASRGASGNASARASPAIHSLATWSSRPELDRHSTRPGMQREHAIGDRPPSPRAAASSTETSSSASASTWVQRSDPWPSRSSTCTR